MVQPIFEEYVADERRRRSRLTFAAVDFFTDPLPKADVVMMGHILHDWDLAQKKMLVRKAYDALPPGGAFIVYEAIIDDDRRQNAFGLLMSLNMLIETPGGFDYTGADCIGWMKEAGSRSLRRAPGRAGLDGRRHQVSATMPILGLHHVTATVDDAQDDLDFCLGGLGLRLVKKTVNFDNHHVYHFYYGDERGTPGTIWTTFPYKGRGVPVGHEGRRAR